MHQHYKWAVLLAAFLTAGSAYAEDIKWVNASRIRFCDAVPEATGALGDLDLGAAPPPGSSRLFSEDELRNYAYQAHLELASLRLPRQVRVKRATHRYTSAELESLLRPAIIARLAPGVHLQTLRLPNSFLGVPGLDVGQISLPKLPKRAGAATTTATVELRGTDSGLGRIPVTMELLLDEAATRYALERGSTLNLVIDNGWARISAASVLMSPADVGDVVPCQVIRTRKVIRARINSLHEASVVDQ